MRFPDNIRANNEMAESGSLLQLKEDLNNVCLLSFLIYFQFSLKSPFNFLRGKEYFILNNDKNPLQGVIITTKKLAGCNPAQKR